MKTEKTISKKTEYIHIDNPNEKLLNILSQMKERKEKRKQKLKQQTFQNFVRI